MTPWTVACQAPPWGSVNFILKFYLSVFTFGCTGSSLLWWALPSCGAWASHCRGFFCCRAQALACSFCRFDHRALGHGISGHGTRLCCPVTFGIFPDQRLNLCPLHWQAGSQPLDHQGSPVLWFYVIKHFVSQLKLSRRPLAFSGTPDAKSWLIGKYPDAGKDWGQEEKGATANEMARWRYWLRGREFAQTPGDSEGQRSLQSMGSQRVGHGLSNRKTVGPKLLMNGFDQSLANVHRIL